MISVSGYHSQKIVRQSDRSVICTAVRERDNLAVDLKYPHPESASLDDITRYHKEFETLSRIRSNRVISVHSILEEDGLPVIIMEHVDYLTLAEIIDQRSLTILEAISLTANIAKALDDIHSFGVVYKNMSASNILCSIDLAEIRLTEFGIASFQNVAHLPQSNDKFEGALDYLSPEQTGRLSRPIDYRSDIYSLGIVFYQLLTGQLPFHSSDYLEVIFQHLARTPEPPSSINAKIPSAIDKIVFKLIAKDPEERYQSTYAIISDLEQVTHLIASPSSQAQNFVVGLDDIPEQLFIPHKLLNRSDELKNIEKLLGASANGEFGCIELLGAAGTGKTALLREISKLTLEQSGVVSIMKPSLANSDVPNSGIAAILNDLARLLLTREDLQQIGNQLSETLGGSAHLLFTLAPDMQKVIRNVPDYEGARNNPIETRNRLIRVVSAFLRVLCENVKPLVICVDNLQWIDTGSLEILQSICKENRVAGLLLVLAHRSEQESKFNEGINTSDVIQIKLNNLQKHDIQILLSECLFRSVEEVEDLTTLVISKTQGNPQAIREFINELHKSNHLFFDRIHREWSWDLEKSAQLPPTNNVGEVLARDLKGLDSTTLQVLKIAACVGDEFGLDTIKRVSQMSFSETSACLNRAVADGFLLYQGNDRPSGYQFSHDKIQEAAYLLLESFERKQIHAQIGKTYQSQNEVEDKLFDVVNQLNNSVQDPGADTDDPTELATLNLEAGRKAKRAGAFQASFRYLRTAIAVQGKHVWQNYELSLEIHLEAAEAAYYCGDKKQLDSLIISTLQNATNAYDKSRAQEIQLRALIAYSDLEQAIEIGHQVLDMLGHPVPKKINKAAITYWILKTLIRARLTAQQNHKMESRESRAAMRILMILCHAGYLSGRPITAAYTLTMTNISLENGLAPESSFAYPLFGALIISYFGTITTGYHFGTLALENLDQRNPELFCRTNTVVHNFISFWKCHLGDTLGPLAEAEKIGFETGDIEFAQIAATTRCVNGFFLGQDLNTLDANFQSKNTRASEFNQTPMLSMGLIFQQTIRNLMTTTQVPAALCGELYDEVECMPMHVRDKDYSSMTTLYVMKTFLAVLFREHETSYVFAKTARRSLESLISSPTVSFFVLFESLAYISQIRHASALQLPKLRLRVHLNLRLLRKWTQHAPMNTGHAYHLVQAELAAINLQPTQAIDHYEMAMALAEKNGHVHLLGLIQEMAGRFFLRHSKETLSTFYLRRARSSYVRWGAVAKVYALDQEFEALADERSIAQFPRKRQLTQYPATSERMYDNFFDLGSVIKASQVLSGEIILETLLEKLMQVALENAGAHSAGLVLTDGDDLYVEILSRYNGAKTDHKLKREKVSQSKDLPVSVIQYVARTEEDLVLNDATANDIFIQDDYILNVKPRSILCFPILSKSHLIGVLYLENLQNTHAFNQDRVAVLKLLASQSAIAIENAKLYQQLNDSRNKYLALYENAVEGIFEINMKGELMSTNPAAAQLMGYPGWIEGAPRQVDFSQFFVNPTELTEFTRRLLKEQRVVGFETLLRRFDNKEIWVAISAHQINNADGQPERMEGSVIDITERKLRQQAEQATRLAEAATITKSQFLANMSHEIRTPMNAILGYTRLALNTTQDEKQLSYLETIKASSDHLLRVVNDILDISKIESGKMELQQKSFCLEDVLRDVDQLFRLEAQEKGLEFSMPSFPNSHYIGDSVRLGQILINLIGNAVKFTQQGKISVELDSLPLHDGSHCLNFLVSDTGEGIPEAELETIFDAFTQTTNANNESGTGLGLAISKNLIQKMRGHIHASSIEGVGSKFYFTVVLEPTTEFADQATETLNNTESQDGKTLLLVEDNPINRELATEVLQSSGYEVLQAADGQEALDVLAAQTVFCILMDLRMPRMSGNEAIKIIRAREDLKHYTVIALSAGVLQHEIDEALQNGFDHYVTKPVDFDGLLHLLADISGNAEPPVPKVASKKKAGPIILDVDFGVALVNHDDDEQLLQRLTQDFVHIYGGAAEQLRQTLNPDSIEQAERLIHNIAGVAGSFGAKKLMNDCRQLEQLIRAQGTLEEHHIELFEAELNNLLNAIEEYQSGIPKELSQG